MDWARILACVTGTVDHELSDAERGVLSAGVRQLDSPRPRVDVKAYTPEQAIGMLREAEVRLSQGEKIGKICRGLGISEQSYYRWRRLYGGLKVDQARRLKDLERENQRLKKAVSELTLDKQILKEALEGKY